MKHTIKMASMEENNAESFEDVETEDTETEIAEGENSEDEDTEVENNDEATDPKDKDKKKRKMMRMPQKYWKDIKGIEQSLQDENVVVSKIEKEKEEVIDMIKMHPCIIFASGMKIAQKKRAEAKEVRRFIGTKKILEALESGEDEVALVIIILVEGMPEVEVVVFGDWEGKEGEGAVVAFKKRGSGDLEGTEEVTKKKEKKKFCKMPKGKAKKMAQSILTKIKANM